MRDLFEVANPTVGILLEENNVTAKNRSESYGPGRLFVTEECVFRICICILYFLRFDQVFYVGVFIGFHGSRRDLCFRTWVSPFVKLPKLQSIDCLI